MKLKKIVTFGCSWTGGYGHDGERYHNWPAELALLTQDKYEIINAGSGRTDITYSMFVLKKYLEEYKPDFVIFQFTTSYRKSWINLKWPHNQSFHQIFDIMTDRQYLKTKYFEFPIDDVLRYDDLKNFKRINIKPSIKDYWSMTAGYFPNNDIAKFASLYYGILGDNCIEPVITDSYYLYVKNLLKGIPHLLCVQNQHFQRLTEFQQSYIDVEFRNIIGGDSKYEKYRVDAGQHLNSLGLQKIAIEMQKILQGRL